MKVIVLIIFSVWSLYGFSQQLADKYYVSVEQMPHYPGGEAEMMMFFTQNLKPVPIVPDSMGIKTRLVAKFVVNEEGKVSDVKIICSMGESMDNEFIRVINLMPRWIPGKQNDRTVACYYTLLMRIHFQQ